MIQEKEKENTLRSSMRSSSSFVTLLGLFAIVGRHDYFIASIQAFTTVRPKANPHNMAVPVSSRSYTCTRSRPAPIFATSDDVDHDELFPAMTREDLGVLLDSVPVFAVTEPNKEGIVLLKEKDNSNDIAYFFFSAETANAVYAPLREKTKDAKSWDITQYPLGVVWFELFKNPEPGIEYRLVPDAVNMGGARTLLEEQSKQLGVRVPDNFQKGYNDIPVFMDQRLRIQSADGEEMFPMYLGLQDLVSTLQQASGEYEAALNVASLEALLEQMQDKSENDFRKSVLVPPSPQTSTNSESGGAGGSAPKKTIQDQMESDDEPFSTPTAVNNWDD